MRSTNHPIKYLFIDVDNCLVPYEDNYVPYVTDIIVEAVLELDENARRLFKGDRDLVRRLADEFYLKYGQSVLGFSTEHNFPISKLCNLYHEKLDPDKCVNPSRNDKDHLYDFKKWLSRAKQQQEITDYVAFTQSTGVWARKILFDKCSLQSAFNSQNIISAEIYGHGFKHRDRAPYEIAMQRMGVHSPEECLVIDDSRSVLRFAFEKMGMRTCLISHGQPVAEEHKPYLSAIANNIADVPRRVVELSR